MSKSVAKVWLTAMELRVGIFVPIIATVLALLQQGQICSALLSFTFRNACIPNPSFRLSTTLRVTGSIFTCRKSSGLYPVASKSERESSPSGRIKYRFLLWLKKRSYTSLISLLNASLSSGLTPNHPELLHSLQYHGGIADISFFASTWSRNENLAGLSIVYCTPLSSRTHNCTCKYMKGERLFSVSFAVEINAKRDSSTRALGLY